jgi:hypothetical protein
MGSEDVRFAKLKVTIIVKELLVGIVPHLSSDSLDEFLFRDALHTTMEF